MTLADRSTAYRSAVTEAENLLCFMLWLCFWRVSCTRNWINSVDWYFTEHDNILFSTGICSRANCSYRLTSVNCCNFTNKILHLKSSALLRVQRLCSRLTALWRYINFVLLLLLLLYVLCSGLDVLHCNLVITLILGAKRNERYNETSVIIKLM